MHCRCDSDVTRKVRNIDLGVQAEMNAPTCDVKRGLRVSREEKVQCETMHKLIEEHNLLDGSFRWLTAQKDRVKNGAQPLACCTIWYFAQAVHQGDESVRMSNCGIELCILTQEIVAG